MTTRSTMARSSVHTLSALALVASAALATPGAAVAALGDCSQPLSSGSEPVATDCLLILRAAVGTATCSPECICAPKGTLPVSATDALLCLQVATGQEKPLDCPCDGGTTTTSSSTSSSSSSSTTSSSTSTSLASVSTTLLDVTTTLPAATTTTTVPAKVEPGSADGSDASSPALDDAADLDAETAVCAAVSP